MRRTTHIAITTSATLLAALAAIGNWLLPGGMSCATPTHRSNAASNAPAPESFLGSPTRPTPSTASIENLTSRELRLRGTKTSHMDKGPWELTLADGQQEVILKGQASLALQFNEVAGEEFPTIRVSAGATSIPNPILGAGERIEFSSQGLQYRVSVLSIDHDSRKVRVRIDQVQ